jgi:hypothetical protein
MTYHITVSYAGGRPTLWSYGYPSKASADRAAQKLNKAKTSKDMSFKVKKG